MGIWLDCNELFGGAWDRVGIVAFASSRKLEQSQALGKAILAALTKANPQQDSDCMPQFKCCIWSARTQLLPLQVDLPMPKWWGKAKAWLAENQRRAYGFARDDDAISIPVVLIRF